VTDDILGTGVAFPVEVDPHGALSLVEGAKDVEQAIEIILSTAPGERPMRPEFGCGVHRLVFERMEGATLGRVEREIRRALKLWEPRINVEAVSIDLDERQEGRLLVSIDYRLRATRDRRNLIYPFYIVPAGAPR
jgi:phage baseplate assembly protein W